MQGLVELPGGPAGVSAPLATGPLIRLWATSGCSDLLQGDREQSGGRGRVVEVALTSGREVPGRHEPDLERFRRVTIWRFGAAHRDQRRSSFGMVKRSRSRARSPNVSRPYQTSALWARAGGTDEGTARPHQRLEDGAVARGRQGITTEVCNHTFRGTGITAYLENGATLEKAGQMAAHASTRTTQLYDRREDRVTFDEVVKINIHR